MSRPNKIALIGSAPSSLGLAPWGDPSYEVWGCSPGVAPHAKRIDAWFEIHYFDERQPQAHGWGEDVAGYLGWLHNLTVPVYVMFPLPDVPMQRPYPREEMLQKFGHYFFTSSIAWMLAMAIERNPEEIGLWGVDMSAFEEYGYQRAGCHHFIELARSRGIKVTVPPESDLLQPPPLYGAYRASRMSHKMHIRKQEIERQIAEQAGIFERARERHAALQGARAELEYHMNTWLGDLPEEAPRAIDAHRSVTAGTQDGEVIRLNLGAPGPRA